MPRHDSCTVTINACLAMAKVIFFWIMLRLNIMDRSTLPVALYGGRKILNPKFENNIVAELRQGAEHMPRLTELAAVR